MVTVDLNVDLGESAQRWESGEDPPLLEIATSANVCCGAYAGDAALIEATCRAAVEHGVAIGAQVGYRDREGFGRRDIDLPPRDLTAEVLRQVEDLQAIADRVGGTVSYLKPHGALYHRISHDPAQAAAIIEALLELPLPLPLLAMPHSRALALAREADLPTRTEGFADRAYTPTGGLVPRSEPGAVLHDPAEAIAQARRLTQDVDSLCVHSDSPGAVDLLRKVRAALEADGVDIRSLG